MQDSVTVSSKCCDVPCIAIVISRFPSHQIARSAIFLGLDLLFQEIGTFEKKGKTARSPGNTRILMEQPKMRKDSIADHQTAKFIATINIEEPTFVTIEVVAPVNHKQSQVKATTELWLIPGKHIMGDGIILEIPGFIIDVLEPRTHNFIPLTSLAGKSILVKSQYSNDVWLHHNSGGYLGCQRYGGESGG